MRINPLISAFYINNFSKDVSSPYTDLQAYRNGLIDENGNFIKPEEETDSYEYFVIKLKKIFDELPPNPTKSALNSYLSTYRMFTEEISWYGVDKEHITFFIEGLIAAKTNGELSYIELLEDMGTGVVAGDIGVPANAPNANKGGVSGYDPVMGQMQRRKDSILGFDKCEMFDVCPEEYERFKSAQTWKNAPAGATRNYLQRFERRNPEAVLALRNSDTGDIHVIKYKNKNIVEEHNLDVFLDSLDSE